MRTKVGIVGAGPAGLLLSHLLDLEGIASVVIEARSRETVEATIRAGVLEQTTVDLLKTAGLGQRLAREGVEHHGIELRFDGEGRRIDFKASAGGRAVTLYPQHEVLKDLIAARLAAGGTILFEASCLGVDDITSTSPVIRFRDADGREASLSCDFAAGCDGTHGVCRHVIPKADRRDYVRVYPFAWFGILASASPSSHELIYASHERGFALVSTRTPDVQRLYFQCDPEERTEDWPNARIWEELQARVEGGGFRLAEGPIFQKNIIPMRSFVTEPMRHGQLFLAGDAAHSVPPTGAKGLNMAVADVHLLARGLTAFYKNGSCEILERYSATALRRVWQIQHFSWWMTSMMHRFADASTFDRRRQRAEWDQVTSTAEGAAYLARNYTGLPLPA